MSIFGVHYMALKIFKWKLNNLTKARFEKKKWHLTFEAKKALELTIVGFQNSKPDTNCLWNTAFAMLNINVHFLKILLYREIIFKSIK